MSTVRDTIRNSLFSYPTLFRTPRDVLDNLFCSIGTGWEWDETGELTNIYPYRKRRTMNYTDLKEDADKLAADKLELAGSGDVLATLWASRDLKCKAERIQRRFIAANIETLLDEPLADPVFGQNVRHRHGKTEGVSIKYSNALNFPDNITKEWGQVLLKYLDHWLYTLNIVYGVSGQPGKHDDVSWWPENAQETRQAIKAAKERLFPLVNDGLTYAAHCEASREWVTKVIAAIRKE